MMEKDVKIFTAITAAFLLVSAIIFMYIMSHKKPKLECKQVIVAERTIDKPN